MTESGRTPGARGVGPGCSPLDEDLGLLPGALTPTLPAHLSRLGSRLRFAAAASELGHLKGVRVATATARRHPAADGAVYAAWQDAAAVRVLADPPPPRRGPAPQQVSVDGAMVPLVDGSWREGRTLAIGTVVPGRTPGTVRCEDRSSCSRLADADRFIGLAAGEGHRRGVETAGRVAGVGEGAGWCQHFLDAHRPDAVRLLDVPQGAQRRSDGAEAVWGAHATGRVWAAAQRSALRDGTAETVLAAIRLLPVARGADGATATRVQGEVRGYLTPRGEQMRYAAFRAQGLPIGSGAVERANQRVVAARLQGAGRRWAESNVTPMVAWRGAVCSARWDEAWATIAGARRERPQRQPAAPLTMLMASAASVAAPVRRPCQPPSPALPRLGPQTIVTGRPTAAHPGKRFAGSPLASPAKL